MHLCLNIKFCAKRATEIIVPPKEMLLSFSSGTFLTNYDVIIRKLKYVLIHSTVQKRATKAQNKSIDTTHFTNCKNLTLTN